MPLVLLPLVRVVVGWVGVWDAGRLVFGRYGWLRVWKRGLEGECRGDIMTLGEMEGLMDRVWE